MKGAGIKELAARFVLGLMAIALGYFAFVMWATWHFGTTDRAGKAGCIVVLGCMVYDGGRPSTPLRARTLHAADLYKAGLAPKVLVMGGVGENPPAEGVVMRGILLDAGVLGNAIIVEDESCSTIEQAEYAGVMLDSEKVKSIIVVTDFFHEWRACKLFENQGFETLQSPALESPLYRWKFKAFYYSVREGFSILKLYWLRAILVLMLWGSLAYFWTRLMAFRRADMEK